MFSIGTLSRRTGVKIPTIRYYEDMGLLPEPERTAGNQRRYSQAGLDRLGFIKHARDLGFTIEAIRALIELHEHPDHSCATANAIANAQLSDVQAKIARLKRLETELQRIATHCDGSGTAGDCYVLTSLADHSLCETAH
ncbi:MerR family transcriptional regulator [Loktanella sp. S4079]|uniref:MerR family transcriptional regulator n=1 Tax=Loktanella sp. S4079 TaxID=579483 RepID=UPI0005FA03A2|nr:helix-turn-helix domain-containing protein [Loktanella sp. S4079]KJZ19620.1 MerR family transcriptional regulator [Loktanella sp. S4079]